jgi:medium-chain acyl-[acyl-carrier-protein] hydrolase
MSETPATDMRNVVTSLAGEIHLLIRPDAIFYGQCLGALVAFEVASELGRIGSVLPDRVIVASQVAPQRYQTGEHISRYENNDFRVAVKALGGLPMEIENDEVAWNLIAPVLRADFRLGESYEPNTDPIPVPITALIGTDDQLTNPNEVRDWRTCSTAGFDLEIVPGNHFLNRTSSKEIMDAIEARTVCGRGSRGSVNQ